MKGMDTVHIISITIITNSGFIWLWKSMNPENKRGPSIDPCGTPHVKGVNEDTDLEHACSIPVIASKALNTSWDFMFVILYSHVLSVVLVVDPSRNSCCFGYC